MSVEVWNVVKIIIQLVCIALVVVIARCRR